MRDFYNLFGLGVILAAGEGLRMRPLTATTPKPLLNLHYQALLGHQIKFLRSHVESLAVTVGYQREKVGEYALNHGANYVINNFQKGNAAWINLELIKNTTKPIVIVTCDNLMRIDLQQLFLESSHNPDLSLIVTTKSTETQAGDRILETEGRVRDISGKVKSDLIGSGLQILNPKTLTEDKIFNDFHEVWSDLIIRDSLYVSKQRPTKWSAIDTMEDLDAACHYWEELKNI